MNPIRTTALAAALSLAVTAQAGPVTYRVDLIAAGDSAECLAMNHRGDLAGTIAVDPHVAYSQDAVVITAHAMRRSGYSTGRASSIAVGLDDHRIAVGWIVADPSEGTPIAAFWTHDGAQHRLAGGSLASQARAINAHGVVAGWAISMSGLERAVTWQHGKLVELDPGRPGAAYAINDAGQAAGWSSLASMQVPTIFAGGAATPIGTLGGSGGGIANGINGAGHVVGQSFVAGNAHVHAFFYDGAMQDLGAPADRDSYAYAINASDVAVGASFGDSGEPGIGLVWIGRTMYALDDLLDPVTGAGWRFVEAAAIDDSGRICARGSLGAAVLTPM